MVSQFWQPAFASSASLLSLPALPCFELMVGCGAKLTSFTGCYSFSWWNPKFSVHPTLLVFFTVLTAGTVCIMFLSFLHSSSVSPLIYVCHLPLVTWPLVQGHFSSFEYNTDRGLEPESYGWRLIALLAMPLFCIVSREMCPLSDVAHRVEAGC